MARTRFILLRNGYLPETLIRQGLELIERKELYAQILLSVWSAPAFWGKNPEVVADVSDIGRFIQEQTEGYLDRSLDSFQDLVTAFTQLSSFAGTTWQPQKYRIPKLTATVLQNDWPHLQDDFQDKVEFTIYSDGVEAKADWINRLFTVKGAKPQATVTLTLPPELWDIIGQSMQYQYLTQLRFRPKHRLVVEIIDDTKRTDLTLIIRGLDRSVLASFNLPVRFWVPFGLPGLYGRNWELSLFLQTAYQQAGSAFACHDENLDITFVARFPRTVVKSLY